MTSLLYSVSGPKPDLSQTPPSDTPTAWGRRRDQTHTVTAAAPACACPDPPQQHPSAGFRPCGTAQSTRGAGGCPAGSLLASLPPSLAPSSLPCPWAARWRRRPLPWAQRQRREQRVNSACKLLPPPLFQLPKISINNPLELNGSKTKSSFKCIYPISFLSFKC